MPALIIRGFKLVQNGENNFFALIRGRIKSGKFRFTMGPSIKDVRTNLAIFCYVLVFVFIRLALDE